MAKKNPTDDGSAVALTISVDQAQILRPLLEMVRDGIREELVTHLSQVREPARLRGEGNAYERLLVALEVGSVVPDPNLGRVLAELSESIDAANEYSRVVAEHDALDDLLAQVKGVSGEAS